MTKQWLLFAAKAAITALIIWLLIGKLDLAPVGEALGRITLSAVALVIVMTAAQMAIATLRWSRVLKAVGTPVGFLAAFRFLAIGLFFNQALPSSIGGDALRVWYIRRLGAPLAKSVHGVLLDRMMALVALLLIVAAALPVLFGLVGDPVARSTLPAMVLVGLVGFVGLLVLGTEQSVLDRWRPTRSLAGLARDARSLFLSPAAPGILLLSAAIHGLTIVIVWVLGRDINPAIEFGHCLVIVPPVLLLSVVPISLAGWGVREGAMVVAFGFVDIAMADAFALSVTMGLSLIVAGVPGGLIWLVSTSHRTPGRVAKEMADSDTPETEADRP